MDIVPGVERWTQVCAAISRLEQVSRGIPTIEITIIAHSEVDASDKSSGTVNGEKFLMQCLRDMEDRTAALIQTTLNGGLSAEFLLFTEGIVNKSEGPAQV
jgi:hypothetical protein